MPELLHSYGAVLLTLALFASVLWASYAAGNRLAEGRPAYVRWSAAAVAAYWSLVATFLLLASCSLFRNWAAVPLWLAVAAVATRLGGGWRKIAARLGDDLRAAASAFGRLSAPTKALLLAGAALVALRFVRGLVAPPMTSDALTYHLLKAGRWVQTGGFQLERAPDVPGAYEYFLPFGDVTWAWSMLASHDDAFLVFAYALVWLSLALGVYAAARSLGAATEPAALAAAAVAFSPASALFVTTGYVEIQIAALFFLGFTFVVLYLRDNSAAYATLAAAALGVGAGVKMVGLPALALGIGALGLVVLARPATGRGRALTLASIGVVVLVALAPYFRAWVDMGSPTWPIPLAFGPVTIFGGDGVVAGIQSGKPRGLLPPSLPMLYRALFVPDSGALFHRGLYLNFSPATPLLIVFACWGAIRLVVGRRDRWALVYLLAVVALILAGVMSPGAVALRSVYAGILGRHLLVPVGAAAVLAAVPGVPLGRWANFLAAAAALPLVLPTGLGSRDYQLVPLLLGGLAVAAAVAAVARYVRVRPAAAFGLVCLLAYPAVLALRSRNRHGYYEDLALGRVFDMHPLGYVDATSAAAWEFLDQGRGLTIAFSGGVSSEGDNWIRYPLLGEHLQNRVIYVPVTPDGSIVDIRDPEVTLARADFASWEARLVERGVDYVVVKPPPCVEAQWLDADPALFTRVDLGPGDSYRVYRFNRR